MEAPDPALTRHTEIAETLSEGQTDQVIGESGVWTGWAGLSKYCVLQRSHLPVLHHPWSNNIEY